MSFWQVIKEVSAQQVRTEAGRPFVLGLAGDPAAVAAARAAVLGPQPDPATVEAAEEFLCCASPPYDEAAEMRLRYADLLVSLPGGPGLTQLRPADTLKVEDPAQMIAGVLEHRPDLRVSLARRLPGFRPAAAEQVVREVSRVNAEFAAIAGIPASFPILAPFFPAMVGADILVLTKNQVLMVYRLAALYGESLELKARAGEALGVIGGAFGWRTLARQLLSLLPGPAGLPARAAIAYTGTYAVGRGAQILFDEGRRPTRVELQRILEEARHLFAGVAATLRRPRRGEGDPPRPEGENA